MADLKQMYQACVCARAPLITVVRREMNFQYSNSMSVWDAAVN